MIQVLLVDDSEVSLMVLRNILESEQDISIIGVARDGAEAIHLASRLSPDIISMDINMPGLDGFSTTRHIMENTPVPIIIVSGIDNLEEIQASFRAVEAGALGVYRKPPAVTDPDFRRASQELISAIRTYSEVRVVKRRDAILRRPIETPPPVPDSKCCTEAKVIVMGASTGGPQAVQEILKNLPANFALPIILVQHMSPGFIEGYASWLSDSTGIKTRVAGIGEKVRPGILYVAPDGKHTGISKDLTIEFSASDPEHNLRPSVSYLFRTAAKNCGNHAVGVLLSGMGTDGARELLDIRKKGGCTIIQNKETAFVYGMPGAADILKAGMYSLSPREIAVFLSKASGGFANGE